jgi:hypothetical protein
MAQTTTVNSKNGIVVVRSDVSGSLNLNDGSFPANVDGETVSAMYIAEVTWSCATSTGAWTLSRGANVVWTCHGQNGHIDFKQDQMRLESGDDSTGDVSFTLSGAGHIVLKMNKQSGAN